MKRPAFQFYPADWLRNVRLRACSHAARALWMDLLCYMHDCEPYGHLAIDGEPIDDVTGAQVCGVPVGVYRRLLAEIEARGVSSRTEAGVLFSRRLVKDHAVSEARSGAGSIGGATTQAIAKQSIKQPHKQSVEVEDGVAIEGSTHTQRASRKDQPVGFDEAWAAYPKRPNNSKERARKAYLARLAEGCDPAVILDGVLRYAVYVRREKTEARFIKQAATFFGPDRHWESDYTSSGAKPAQPVVEYQKYTPPKVEGPAFAPVREGEIDPRLVGLVGSIGRPMPKGAA